MKRYCFDTSALSNPLEQMPEDIHRSLWYEIKNVIGSGVIGVTPEIYQEMLHLPGSLGKCIKNNKGQLILAPGIELDMSKFAANSNQILKDHHNFISEYSGGSAKTACLNDMTIVILAKTLNLPLVSMESPATGSQAKRRIPDVCKIEGIQHLTFSQYLRLENIRI